MALRLAVPSLADLSAIGEAFELHEIEDWIARLPTDPLVAGRLLIERVSALNATRVRIPLRQSLSERFLMAAERIVPTLETRLTAGQLPLTGEAREAATVALTLVNQLAISYKLLLVEQSRRLFGLASSGRAHLPVQRAMMLLNRSLQLSYRSYASTIKGTWTDMHEIHSFALRRGLAWQAIAPRDTAPSAIYKEALLVAFADPRQFSPAELDVVIGISRSNAHLAELSRAESERVGPGLFLVKRGHDTAGLPLTRRAHTVTRGEDLAFNALPVASTVSEYAALVATGGSLKDVGPGVQIDRKLLGGLLGRLGRRWGAIPPRQSSRLRTRARVEVHVGIARIQSVLIQGARATEAASEWIVTNESPSGFALAHLRGPLHCVQVGEVVAIRSHDAEGLHICVVRWVLSDNPDHLELGLEEIAASARAASLRSALPDPQSRAHPALLLPEIPAKRQGPALLAPIMPLDAPCELSVGDFQAKVRVTVTSLIERTSAIQVLHFRPAC